MAAELHWWVTNSISQPKVNSLKLAALPISNWDEWARWTKKFEISGRAKSVKRSQWRVDSVHCAAHTIGAVLENICRDALRAYPSVCVYGCSRSISQRLEQPQQRQSGHCGEGDEYRAIIPGSKAPLWLTLATLDLSDLSNLPYFG